MKINNVLLVGGSGYVGCHLSAALLAQGYGVSVTGTGNKDAANYLRIDFEDAASFLQLEGKHFDLIVVLAARLNALGTTQLDHPDLQINTTRYANFLAFLAKNNITERLIYFSSMTVYAPLNNVPVKEDGFIAPVHTYGLSKVLAETTTSFFCNHSAVSGVVFRIPGVYGGDRHGGFIYNTIQKIAQNEVVSVNTNGLVFWETIHVDDLSDMIVSFLKTYKWEMKFDVFNICYGKETDFYETIDFIRKSINPSATVEKEAMRGYRPFHLSNEKISRLIPVKEDYYGKLETYIKSVAG